MPKLIVLFHGGDQAAASLAESAAVGAKGVRFTEVAIRSVGPDGGQKALDSVATLRDYHGVLVAYSGEEPPAVVLSALDEVAKDGQLPNTTFGVTGLSARALHTVARTGGIIVAEPTGADPHARARNLGERVAKVVGWVHHALGHEAQHHQHSHEPQKPGLSQ